MQGSVMASLGMALIYFNFYCAQDTLIIVHSKMADTSSSSHCSTSFHIIPSAPMSSFFPLTLFDKPVQVRPRTTIAVLAAASVQLCLNERSPLLLRSSHEIPVPTRSPQQQPTQRFCNIPPLLPTSSLSIATYHTERGVSRTVS